MNVEALRVLFNSRYGKVDVKMLVLNTASQLQLGKIRFNSFNFSR
jgi:hypothetical protein